MFKKSFVAVFVCAILMTACGETPGKSVPKSVIFYPFGGTEPYECDTDTTGLSMAGLTNETIQPLKYFKNLTVLLLNLCGELTDISVVKNLTELTE